MTDRAFDVFAPNGTKLVTAHNEQALMTVLGIAHPADFRGRMNYELAHAGAVDAHGNGRLIIGCNFVTVRLAA